VRRGEAQAGRVSLQSQLHVALGPLQVVHRLLEQAGCGRAGKKEAACALKRKRRALAARGVAARGGAARMRAPDSMK
jgi:hypothetical protein